MSNQFATESIAVDQIRENAVALRAVNRDSEHYQGIVASIRAKGFVGTISVRPQTDDKGVAFFELIDGLHRFNAAKDAGLASIPCTIMPADMTKEAVLETQIMMNLHKVETRPIEFTHALQRLMAANPAMTLKQLAANIGKSDSWIISRLGLLKLEAEIQKIVDDGKITLSNAFTLAKLPKDEQSAFVERAMTMPPAEFGPTVNARAKEIRDARKAGRDPNAPTFQPVAFLQKKGDIEAEAASLANLRSLISESNAQTAIEGAEIALKWVLNMDARSIAVQQAKHDERIAQAKELAEKRKLDRANKKAQEAAAEAEELNAKYAAAAAPAEQE